MTHAASKTESANGSNSTRTGRNSLRLRLLSGAASLALPVASMIVAVGVCVPDAAHAQTTVNPVQTTTFTLVPAQNPTIFDTGTNIDTTATVGASGVSGDASTQWTVVNKGKIAADYRGISLDGAGSNVTNHGTISQTDNLVGSAGIFLGNGGLVVNTAGATISTFSEGVLVDNGLGTVVNSGTITSTSSTAVHLVRNGSVTNEAGGVLSGKFFAVHVTGFGSGTVSNAGSITATDSVDGVGVSGLISTLINLNGGTISGGKTGIVNGVTGSTITNEQGATISGGTNGIDGAAGTVANAGTITGGTNGILSFSGFAVTNAGMIEATGANGFAVKAGGTTDVTITDNSGTIQATNAGGVGIFAGGTATVSNNTGTIKGAASGISAGTADVTANAGTISGNTGVFATGTAKVNNLSGGTITGNAIGIQAGTLDVTNAAGATISGSSDAGIVGAGTVTNAGTISGGTASVRFSGTGTNTLTLKDSSVLNGDAVGSTAAGATNKLVLQGQGTANNNFRNFNSLDVQGVRWALNGNTSVGIATVSSGTLVVGDGGIGHDNAKLTGDVTVNNLGVLFGRGTIAGNVNILGGGVIDSGATGFTTLRVIGNVTFQNSSIYQVSVDGGGQNSKLNATGTATLFGGSVAVGAGGTFAPSTQYTILTAAGGLSGTFAGGVTTNLAFLTPTLSYDANNVKLTLVTNGGGTGGGGTGGGGSGGGGTGTGGGSTLFGFASVARTPNQSAVATSLDGGPTSNRLVTAVLNQSVDGARQAFDALSGEVYGSVHNAQAEEAQFARGAMLGRMRQASYAGAPGELGALGFAGPQLAYASDSATAAQASAYPVKAPYGPSRDLTFWSLGLGGWGHSDGDGNAASLTSRFGGFLSGVDARFGESWRAGFTAGYVRTDLHANDRASSAGIDSVQLGAYATGRLGVFNVRGGGSYSFDDIDASRSITFPGFTDQTKARLHGNVGQMFGEVGYGMALGNFALEPLAGLAYVHLRNGSFNESGGAAALTGSATHENLGYSSLGLRLASIMPLSNGTVLVPRATVAWQYASVM
jgi:outer membrane autotransporter protein